MTATQNTQAAIMPSSSPSVAQSQAAVESGVSHVPVPLTTSEIHLKVHEVEQPYTAATLCSCQHGITASSPRIADIGGAHAVPEVLEIPSSQPRPAGPGFQALPPSSSPSSDPLDLIERDSTPQIMLQRSQRHQPLPGPSSGSPSPPEEMSNPGARHAQLMKTLEKDPHLEKLSRDDLEKLVAKVVREPGFVQLVSVAI
jgi:hypothetical protein